MATLTYLFVEKRFMRFLNFHEIHTEALLDVIFAWDQYIVQRNSATLPVA
jgi:hypothetical protein